MSNRNAVDKRFITGFSDLRANLEIRNSHIDGKGLFTSTSMRKGTKLLEIIGERIRHEYDPALSDQNPNWIGTGYEEWVKLGPGDVAIYLNHSCCPNVIINEKMELITIVPVKSSDELLLDYSTTELDPYWKMDCSCGIMVCRKTLRSFQFLPEALQKEYMKYLPASFSSTASMLQWHQQAS